MPLFDLGKDAVVLYSTNALTGTFAGSGVTWAAVSNVQNATTSLDWRTAETTVRGASGTITIGTSQKTVADVEVSFNMPVSKTDPAYIFLTSAAYSPSIEFAAAVLSGPIATSGNVGPVSNWQVHGFVRGEDIAGVQTMNVTIRPSSLGTFYRVP